MVIKRPFVGGNWKMHTDLASAVELADDVNAACAPHVETVDVTLFPPFPYLLPVGKTLGHGGIRLGAQDVYHHASGAFTGEVGTDMLVDLNVGYVIVGHSERRHVLGEDELVIGAKTAAALDAGLFVVLCVGETLGEREAGVTEEVTLRQLSSALEGVDAPEMARVVVAYEPVWAIGTGRTAEARDAQAVHAIIRSRIAMTHGDEVAMAVRIVYGGSVKPSNARELFSRPDIDGGLIGGASLVADDFAAIVKAAAETAYH